ncbi:MAG: hypothetical protein HFH32_01260 [Eubacterium sp.]|jgi:polysaccharide pyruvyl transferase WcaK-like protein|nr:hypothetical protein [Eubacterium sp.]
MKENRNKTITIAITAASYSGNKGAAAMLQSSISQLLEAYGERLDIRLMSVYPCEDRRQCPHACVTVVPAQPQKLLFAAFPCAVLYRVAGRCAPVRALLRKNQILDTYLETDLVIDEAGISFSDSRGFVMNTYAFVCMAVPMLLGVPAVKYSQALGPFHNVYNRLLAKLVLPGLKLILARGRLTKAHLCAAGICKNVHLCADGAFSMPVDASVRKRVQKKSGPAGKSRMAALSVSSVVEKKCRKAGIDYCRIMAGFIRYLTNQGWQVFLFPNAARMHSAKPRNNDLMTGDAVAAAYWKQENSAWKSGRKQLAGSFGSLRQTAGMQEGLIWERREMDAEEIRARIAQCEVLVACRFHAMVFALSEQVPVLLTGWSHKYQEVMEQFGLAEYAADFSNLSLEGLCSSFDAFMENQEEIRRRIKKHLPKVQESSRQNVRLIVKLLDELAAGRES